MLTFGNDAVTDILHNHTHSIAIIHTCTHMGSHTWVSINSCRQTASAAELVIGFWVTNESSRMCESRSGCAGDWLTADTAARITQEHCVCVVTHVLVSPAQNNTALFRLSVVKKCNNDGNKDNNCQSGKGKSLKDTSRMCLCLTSPHEQTEVLLSLCPCLGFGRDIKN